MESISSSTETIIVDVYFLFISYFECILYSTHGNHVSGLLFTKCEMCIIVFQVHVIFYLQSQIALELIIAHASASLFVQ